MLDMENIKYSKGLTKSRLASVRGGLLYCNYFTCIHVRLIVDHIGMYNIQPCHELLKLWTLCTKFLDLSQLYPEVAGL